MLPFVWLFWLLTVELHPQVTQTLLTQLHMQIEFLRRMEKYCGLRFIWVSSWRRRITSHFPVPLMNFILQFFNKAGRIKKKKNKKTDLSQKLYICQVAMYLIAGRCWATFGTGILISSLRNSIYKVLFHFLLRLWRRHKQPPCCARRREEEGFKAAERWQCSSQHAQNCHEQNWQHFPFFHLLPSFFFLIFLFNTAFFDCWGMERMGGISKTLQLRDEFRSAWATLSPVSTLRLTDHAGVSMNPFLPVVSSVYSIFTGPKTDHIRGLCSTLPAAHSFPLLFLFPTNSSEAFL